MTGMRLVNGLSHEMERWLWENVGTGGRAFREDGILYVHPHGSDEWWDDDDWKIQDHGMYHWTIHFRDQDDLVLFSLTWC